jgi:hypothetical protein
MKIIVIAILAFLTACCDGSVSKNRAKGFYFGFSCHEFDGHEWVVYHNQTDCMAHSPNCSCMVKKEDCK